MWTPPNLNNQAFNKFFFNIQIFYDLNDHRRKFSTSQSKLSDIDKLLSNLSKHQQEMNKFKQELDERKMKEQEREKEKQEREEEKLLELALEKEKQDELKKRQELENENKTFSERSEKNFEGLIDKHGEVEDKLLIHMIDGYSLLGEKKTREVHQKYKESREAITEKIEKRAMDLEDEFKDDVKSVAYYTSKIDIESARFKKLTQLLEKEEKEIDQEIKQKEDYSQIKEEYEKKRLAFIEEHKEDVKSCRQEKANIKKDIESNLEKPSEMAESLVQETGPDYTGGDD